MTGYACGDCGRWLDTRTIQAHDCIGDDIDGPDETDYTDADLDAAADREVARYEATIYGTDGAA